MEKKQSSFYFFPIANTPNKYKIRHIALLHVSSFLFKIHCFYRDDNYLDPEGKRITLSLATFLKNDNSSCF